METLLFVVVVVFLSKMDDCTQQGTGGQRFFCSSSHGGLFCHSNETCCKWIWLGKSFFLYLKYLTLYASSLTGTQCVSLPSFRCNMKFIIFRLFVLVTRNALYCEMHVWFLNTPDCIILFGFRSNLEMIAARGEADFIFFLLSEETTKLQTLCFKVGFCSYQCFSCYLMLLPVVPTRCVFLGPYRDQTLCTDTRTTSTCRIPLVPWEMVSFYVYVYKHMTLFTQHHIRCPVVF